MVSKAWPGVHGARGYSGSLGQASVTVVGPGDLVVRVHGFDLLSGDRVLGTTITLKTEADAHSPVLALGGRPSAAAPRRRLWRGPAGAGRGQPSLTAQGKPAAKVSSPCAWALQPRAQPILGAERGCVNAPGSPLWPGDGTGGWPSQASWRNGTRPTVAEGQAVASLPLLVADGEATGGRGLRPRQPENPQCRRCPQRRAVRACESWSLPPAPLRGPGAHHGVAIHVDLLVLALVGDAPASQALTAIALLLHLARYLVIDVGWDREGGSARATARGGPGDLELRLWAAPSPGQEPLQAGTP